ncbi:MAG: LptA/OstA family protein [Bauldia sp.]
MGKPLLVGLMFLAQAGLATAPAGADPASAMFTGFQSNSKDPINVDAGLLEITESGKQRISKFSGGVIIRRGDTTLKAATVSLFQDVEAKPPAPKKATADEGAGAGKVAAEPAPAAPVPQKSANKRSFSRIEASGKVVVTSGVQTATGDNAVFNAVANTVVLAGNVVLRQGDSHITGDRLTIDLTNGVARVEQSGGRIKGEFTPGEMQVPGGKSATGGKGTGNGKGAGKTPVPPKPDG